MFGQSSASGGSATKPVPIPPKKNKNAVGVQRKISNITDELSSVPPIRAATNQPVDTKGSVEPSLYTAQFLLAGHQHCFFHHISTKNVAKFC